MEVVHLLSDLCFEGYSLAVEELKKYYDLETLMDLMNNEEISFEIKDAFCHLFTNLYVHIHDHNRLKVDHFIVQWDDLKDFYSFPALDVEVIFKYKPIKYYISQTINYHFIYMDLKNKDTVHQLAYLKSIIELAQKMMEAGFYTELKEINALVKGLKKVLAHSFTYSHATKFSMKDETEFTMTKTLFHGRYEEPSSFDMNISIVQLRECRIAICNFFEFINKIQLMLKQNTAMFRLKNIIQTSGEDLKEEANSEEIGYIYYDQKRIKTQEILDKIGFMVNNMTKEDGFIKMGHDTQSTKQLITLLLSMSFENNISMKVHAINNLMNLFTNCLRVTESMGSVIAIDHETKTYYDEINQNRDEISKYLVSFKSTGELSQFEMVDKADGKVNLISLSSRNNRAKYDQQRCCESGDFGRT